MAEQTNRHDTHNWDTMTPNQILSVLLYELYNPVSSLGSNLSRLTNDEEPLTEEDYEATFEQMENAVSQLSKTIVNLKRYVQEHGLAEKP